MVEQAIQKALLSSPTYHKVQSVFGMYEEGELKGQKAQQMTGITLQKAIEGKFAPKLSQFKVFQGLQVRPIRTRVWQAVINFLQLCNPVTFLCAKQCFHVI